RLTLQSAGETLPTATVVSLVGMAASSYVIFRTRFQPVKNILSGVSNNPDSTTFSQLSIPQKIISVVIISCGTHSISMTFLAIHEAFIKTVKNGLYLLNIIALPEEFTWKNDYGYFIGLLAFGIPVSLTILGYGYNFFVSNAYVTAQFMTSSNYRGRALEGVSLFSLMIVSGGAVLYLMPAAGFAYLSYGDMFKALFDMERNLFYWFTVGCAVVSNTLTFPGQGFRLLGKTRKDFSEWYGSSCGERMGFFGKAVILAVDTAAVSIANYGDFNALTASLSLALLMSITAGGYHVVFNLALFNRPKTQSHYYIPTHTAPIADDEENMSTVRLI
ncbi:MAG: hypothetical protein SFW07_04950, partial [Gammaproteobacteria bacterium]|nr:hypothetical protein [Gammaproteobacteria bacterium]